MRLFSLVGQLIACVVYLLVSVISAQVLNGVSFLGGDPPGLNEKMAAAAFVYTPLALYIFGQLVFRRRAGEYERALFDRAAARSMAFGLLFAVTIQLLHDFVPSVAPVKVEILPALALIMFVATLNLLSKKGLHDGD